MHLFDLDGTLISSNEIWVDVDNLFLTTHNLPHTEEYAYTVGQSILPIAAKFTKEYYNLDVSEAYIIDFWLREGERRYDTVPLKEGALDYLNQCRARGERMALVTACVPKFCQAVLKRLNLEDYFETCIYAQTLGVEKHNPKYFQLVAEHLGVKLSDCTFYDDSPSNCRTAKQAGLKVVGVYDDFYKGKQEELKASCDVYVEELGQLRIES